MKQFLSKLQRTIRFPLLLCIVLAIVGVLQFFLMYTDVRDEQYDVKPFEVSSSTIRAAKTVEDIEKTEENRQAAADNVEPVYTYSEDVAKNQSLMVNSFYDYVIDAKRSVKIDGETDAAKERQKKKQLATLKKELSKIEKKEQLKLSNTELTILLEASITELQIARDFVVTQVESILGKRMRVEAVSDAKASIERNIRDSYSFPENLKSVSVRIGRSAIVETEVEDKNATKEAVEIAKSKIEPTRILQGQIIVQEGEVIDRDVYHQLSITGMLSTDEAQKPALGLALLILLQMGFLYSVFRLKEKNNLYKRRDLIITSLIYLLGIVLMELIDLIDGDFEIIVGFIFPVALTPMLIRILIGERMAYIVTILQGISAGIIFQEGYSNVIQMEVALYIIVGGIASLVFSKSFVTRSQVLRISVNVAVINVVFISFYLLMTQSNYSSRELIFYLVVAVVSGMASGALTLGLLPFIEQAFGILSSFKLIELSSPNHPLLKKILVETPGTYHHSVMVANLADAACEAIGANGLLARVGAYYHDIGKTREPKFFVENQMNGINPHDQLPPETSSDIIIAHAVEGAKMLEAHNMPKEIVDIARQHHGTSLVKFFYHKAKEKNEDVQEKAFRYPGPKPQTKEIAIISVADSVEAAVRSMKDPTPEKIKNLVHAITQDKLQDGQFDECDISIRELKTCEVVFCETLNGIFHSRIEYPKPN